MIEDIGGYYFEEIISVLICQKTKRNWLRVSEYISKILEDVVYRRRISKLRMKNDSERQIFESRAKRMPA